MTSSDDSRHILNGIHKYSDMTTSSLPRPKYTRRRSYSATRANVRFTDEKVTINVGGVRFQTFRATLKQHPLSLLFDLTESSKYFDEQKQEFFFDRSSSMFEYILNYYRTGELHFGGHLCGGQIKKELDFWKLPHTALDECCWLRFMEDVEKEKKRADLKDLVDEAKVAQKAAVDNLREMPPHRETRMTNKIFDFLQMTTIYPDFRLILTALRDSRRMIALFIALLSIATFIFASLIWIVESADTIPSVLSAIWWALVTMTTVGSGGVQPESSLGCLVGMLCIVFGVVAIALPLPIVSVLLNDMRRRLRENELLEERKMADASLPGSVIRQSHIVGDRGRNIERKKNI